MSTSTIDFAAVRASVDLGRVVADYLGPPLKGGRWACPVHGGAGANFEVKGDRWTCYSCGGRGDVIDLVAHLDGVTKAEAARRLDPRGLYSRTPDRVRRPAAPPLPAPPRESDPATVAVPVWKDPAWQGALEGLVSRAERCLYSPAGAPARAWLRARGLDDATVSRFRLGFLDRAAESDLIDALGLDGQGRPRRVWAPRGITIPWVRPGAWYSLRDGDPGARWVGLNIRRLPEGDVSAPLPRGLSKYAAVAGSERGHPYPWAEATAPGEPAVICEGEFDALIAWQEIGHLVNVATFGGAGQGALRPAALTFLARCSDWLLAFDSDDAGDAAAEAWRAKDWEDGGDRCRRLCLPPGIKDLTELYCSGANLTDWIRSEFERFGWAGPGPARPPGVTPP